MPERGFDLAAFRHRAIWNAEMSRIEMRLACTRAHTITLQEGGAELPVTVHLDAGEEIVTEYSYKYRAGFLPEFFTGCGWRPLHIWTDDRGWFSVSLLERSEVRP